VTTAAVPVSVPVPIRIPIREILPWAIFAGIMMLVLLYFVGTEQGALSVVSSPDNWLHEFVHDGRHLLGFPCH
jgi:Probable cobalt transporter subunit (CbtB)